MQRVGVGDVGTSPREPVLVAMRTARDPDHLVASRELRSKARPITPDAPNTTALTRPPLPLGSRKRLLIARCARLKQRVQATAERAPAQATQPWEVACDHQLQLVQFGCTLCDDERPARPGREESAPMESDTRPGRHPLRAREARSGRVDYPCGVEGDPLAPDLARTRPRVDRRISSR